MKKFFSIIPLQNRLYEENYALQYEAVGNTRLQLGHKTRFPIMTALEGYAEPGEEIAVIAVVSDLEAAKRNLESFRAEVQAACEQKQLVCAGVQTIVVPDDDKVSTHVSTFLKLLDYVADDDELFCCMTYGTKPMSTALMMAVQYAYRVKRNTSISCIVYGKVDRTDEQWTGSVYDMTALIQLDEIVRVLADRRVQNPKEILDSLFAQ